MELKKYQEETLRNLEQYINVLNESNSLSQAFYGLTSASLNWERGHFGASLWGKNLFNEEYKAFYFVSMQHPFFSLGKSRQFGISLHYYL